MSVEGDGMSGMEKGQYQRQISTIQQNIGNIDLQVQEFSKRIKAIERDRVLVKTNRKELIENYKKQKQAVLQEKANFQDNKSGQGSGGNLLYDVSRIKSEAEVKKKEAQSQFESNKQKLTEDLTKRIRDLENQKQRSMQGVHSRFTLMKQQIEREQKRLQNMSKQSKQLVQETMGFASKFAIGNTGRMQQAFQGTSGSASGNLNQELNEEKQKLEQDFQQSKRLLESNYQRQIQQLENQFKQNVTFIEIEEKTRLDDIEKIKKQNVLMGRGALQGTSLDEILKREKDLDKTFSEQQAENEQQQAPFS